MKLTFKIEKPTIEEQVNLLTKISDFSVKTIINLEKQTITMQLTQKQEIAEIVKYVNQTFIVLSTEICKDVVAEEKTVESQATVQPQTVEVAKTVEKPTVPEKPKTRRKSKNTDMFENYVKSSKTFSRKEFLNAFPEIPEPTIDTFIVKLKNQGRLKTINRGVYSYSDE